jgi:hypothetical protein
MARLSLPVHSYTLRSTPASTARLVNCYIEALPPDAKTRTILSRAPGVTSFSTTGNGPIRGLHAAFGYLYVVTGTELYQLSSSGSPFPLGDIPGTGLVSMAHNIDTLVIVAEPDAYYTDGVTVSSVTQITDPDFTSRGASYVKFLDNYLLFTEPNSGRFFGSDVGSATDYNALSFATAEASPDDIVGMEVDHRQVILFGTDTGEIWENTGAAGFPFERAINGFFEIGCFNGDTVARLDNSVYWLANDYTIRKLVGITPQRVSNHALEQFLTTTDVTTARAYSYMQDGHFFYVITFTNGCWVYDATTNEWHERSSYPNAYYFWQTAAQAHGRQYVGDAYSDTIGYFDPTVYDEAGSVQRMEFTFQPVYAENRRAFHKSLEIVLETGVGLTTGQGSAPEMMLDYSDDGGLTWASLPNKAIGPIGAYQTRVNWNGLGSARQRVYRCAISDPIKVTIADAILDVEGGRL